MSSQLSFLHYIAIGEQAALQLQVSHYMKWYAHSKLLEFK